MKYNADEILKVFHSRYSCKSFDKTRSVSEEAFSAILEAGRLSPSSFGFEPWKFLVVKSPSLKAQLYDVAWGARNSLDGASHFVIILARKKPGLLHSAAYITSIMEDVQNLPFDAVTNRRKVFENFQVNDFNLTESDRAIFDWACKQSYIALGNMLTVSAFLGVDSCPIEGFNREKVEALLIKEGHLDNEHFGVSVMAGFGYRSEDIRPKSRRDLPDVVEYII